MCVLRWLVLLSSCLVVTGCTNTSAPQLTTGAVPAPDQQSATPPAASPARNDQVNATRRGRNKPTMFAALVPIDLPKNPKTGGYKVCLRDKDKVAWSQRGSSSPPSTGSLLAKALAGTQGARLYNKVVKQSGYAGTVAGLTKRATRAMGLEKVEAMCGNWCGPGHPKDPNANPPVTDPLDAVCRNHDLCYRRRGYQSCACDQQMTDAVLKGRSRLELNAIEQAMIVYFQTSYCTGGCKTVDGMRYCPGDIIKR